MKWSKAIQRKVRQSGWDAFHAGVSIFDFPGGGETKRAAWEIGWRSAKDGQPKPYTTDADKQVMHWIDGIP